MSSTKSARAAAVKAWADMLVNPGSLIAPAPAGIPYLHSSARITKSIDLPYAEMDNGNFLIAVRPDAGEAMISTTTLAAHTYTGATIRGTNGIINKNQSDGYLNFGAGFVYQSNGSCDSATFGVTANGRPALPVNGGAVPSGAISLSCDVSTGPGVPDLTALLSTRAGGVWTSGGTRKVPVGGLVAFVAADFPATVWDAIAVQFLNEDGSPYSANNSQNVQWSFYVPNTGGQHILVSAPRYLQVQSRTLSDVGSPESMRCVACDLLVSNRAAPINAGGELVIARTKEHILANGSISSVMNAIRALPEQRYWRSGNIVDGAYAWMLPDDLASYEPQPVPRPAQSDNVLVAAGTSVAGGDLRIIATWVYEFYTPVQVFDRTYGPTWSPAFQEAYQTLLMQSAVSANAGHLALIAAAKSAIGAAMNFYVSNKAWLDPLIAVAVDKGSQKVMSEIRRAENRRAVKKMTGKSKPTAEGAQMGPEKLANLAKFQAMQRKDNAKRAASRAIAQRPSSSSGAQS